MIIDPKDMGRYFTRTGLIVLISVVIIAGAGSAYAGVVFSTITLGGNVDVLGDIAIRGGTPGAEKILTDSDGSGAAGGLYTSSKSFVVPEFGSIAMIILGISLGVILVNKRFFKPITNFA